MSQAFVVSTGRYLINFIMPDKITSAISSLERKFYQLIISRLDGDKISSPEYRERILGLVEKGIGGFIVFGGEKEEVKTFIAEIQTLAEIPLFIASDIERGVGQQLRGATSFPCQMAIAAAVDRNSAEGVALLERAISAVAAESADIGINFPFIPVMDVNRNPDNPIICTRAFSDSAAEVVWFGSRYIKVLENAGLISCPKHFPGHGDTSVDSHISLPVISKSAEELMHTDVLPFAEAVRAGAGSIMIGHLTVPALDSRPASLSKRVITGLLREELGFSGLVVTDALNMNALDAFGKVPVECLHAGADILLHPADADHTVRELMSEAARNGIDEGRLESSLKRIADAKARLQHARSVQADYQEHSKLAARIVDASITLVRDTKGVLPVKNAGEVQVVFAGDGKFFEKSPLKNYFRSVSTITEMREVKHGTVLFAIFTSVAAWKGSSGIEEGERRKIHEIMVKAKDSIVISFGSPYVLRHFPEADILIAAYEGTGQAQEAVIKCLRGDMDFKGGLPVGLDDFLQVK